MLLTTIALTTATMTFMGVPFDFIVALFATINWTALWAAVTTHAVGLFAVLSTALASFWAGFLVWGEQFLLVTGFIATAGGITLKLGHWIGLWDERKFYTFLKSQMEKGDKRRKVLHGILKKRIF